MAGCTVQPQAEQAEQAEHGVNWSRGKSEGRRREKDDAPPSPAAFSRLGNSRQLQILLLLQLSLAASHPIFSPSHAACQDAPQKNPTSPNILTHPPLHTPLPCPLRPCPPYPPCLLLHLRRTKNAPNKLRPGARPVWSLARTQSRNRMRNKEKKQHHGMQ